MPGKEVHSDEINFERRENAKGDPRKSFSNNKRDSSKGKGVGGSAGQKVRAAKREGLEGRGEAILKRNTVRVNFAG